MKTSKVILQIVRIGITVVIVILILIGLVELGKRGYEFGYRIFTESAQEEAPGKDVVVLIRSDMSKQDVAQLLTDKGLVSDPLLFLVQYRLTSYDKIVPGTYTLNTSMTVHDMAAAMSGEDDTESTEEEE